MLKINRKRSKSGALGLTGIAALSFVFFALGTVFAADINITSSTSWSAGTYSYDNITISNNATLTLGSTTTSTDTNYTDDYGVTINAANITIASGSAISANGKGYYGGWGSIWVGGITPAKGPCPGSSGGTATSGGGGHGGAGGHMSCTNGSATNPVTLGSGGGQANTLPSYTGPSSTYGVGGGAIKLVVSGILENNGTISADGLPGADSANQHSGGGAGGSINITAATLTNTGIIRAKGGNSGGEYSGTGGAGGGGRLHFGVNVWNNTGTLSAAKGTCSYNTSGDGTDGTIDGAVYSAISSPTSGASLNSLLTVSGTAVNYSGGTISYVDITIQRASDSYYYTGSTWSSSQTWLRATGTSSWSYAIANNTSWASSNITIKSRVTTSAITETPGNGVTIYFDNTAPVIASVTLTPSTGYRRIGQTVVITVTLSAAEPNSKLVTPSSATFNGTTVSLGAASNVGPFTGTYTVTAGHANATSPSATGITLTDACGNVSSTGSATSTLVIDAYAPAVSSVTLTPSSGYRKIGQTVTITATATHTTTNLSGAALTLSASSATYNGTSLTASGSNPFTYTYTVASGSTDNPDAEATGIVISDAAGNSSSSASSSGNSVVIDGHAPTVTDAYISVTSTPANGSAYMVGETVTVQWNNSASGNNNSDIASATCNFSTLGGGSAVAMTASSGIYSASYLITTASVNGTNSVSVTATDNAGNATTTEDATDIKVITDTLTLTAPAPASAFSFHAGSTQTISWTKFGTVSAVNLLYSINGGTTYSTIATNQASAGSYTWTVPDLLSALVRIKVVDANEPLVYDTSDVNGAIIIPTLTLTAPSASGISMIVGDTYPITWTSAGSVSNNLRLSLSVNSGSTYSTIASGLSNSGTYDWSVPAPTGDGNTNKIKLEDGTDYYQTFKDAEYANFGGGTLSNTAISGTGASAKVVLSSVAITPVVSGTFTTGFNSYAVAYDPTQNAVWVVNNSSNTLQKFNASTGSQIGSNITTGSYSRGVAYDSTQNAVWVTNYSSNTLQKFNASTGAQIGSNITTDSGPRAVAYDSTQNAVWVANLTSNTLQKFNASTGAQIGSNITTGTSPINVAYDSTQNAVWVVNYGSNTLQKFNASTGAQIGSNITTGSSPYAVAYDPTQNAVWVVNFGSQTLQRISNTGYSSSGTFTSRVLDTGVNGVNALGNLTYVVTTPTGTTCELQMAGSSDNVTWSSFIGPDGTTGSYFTSSSTTIPSALYAKRYLKYKVYLSTSDPTATPEFSSASATFTSGDSAYRTIVASVSANDFTINPISLVTSNVEPASLVVGTTGNAVVSFTPVINIASGDSIDVTFPEGFDITSAAYVNGNISASGATVSGQTLSVTLGTSITAPTAVSFTVSGIKNPADTGAGGTYAITVKDSVGNSAQKAPTVTADTFVNGGALSATNVEPATRYAGVVENMEVDFTTVNPIPADGKIIITFPTGFVVSSGATTAATSTDIGGTLTVSTSGQVVTVTRSGGAALAAGSYSLSLTNIKNPTAGGLTGTYSIQTNTSSASATTGRIDIDAAVAADHIIGAPTATSITPALLNAGATPNTTVALTTVTAIPIGGKIEVDFPAGFDLTGTIAYVSGNDDSTVSVSGNTLTITTGALIGANSSAEIVISGITNPMLLGATGTYAIRTKTEAGVLIDEGTAAANTITLPTLTLLTPSEASISMIVGDTYPITWTSAGSVSNNLRLSLSVNSGSTYSTIASGLSNSGTYDWSVPAPTGDGDTNKIKLEDGTDYYQTFKDSGYANFGGGTLSSTVISGLGAAAKIVLSLAEIDPPAVGLNIATGSNPNDIAYDSTQNAVWVVNNSSNTLQKFNASTGAQIGSNITTGSAPYAVDYDSTQNAVWVVNSSSNTLQKFNASTGAQIGSNIATASTPTAVAYDSTQNAVWVTCNFAGVTKTLQKFNASTGAQIGSNITLANAPANDGLAYDSTQNAVWVVGSKTLEKFNASTGALINSATFVTGFGQNATSLAYDSTQNAVWVGCAYFGSGTLLKFDAATCTPIGGNITTVFDVQRVAYDSTNNRVLVITQYGGSRLQQFNASTKAEISTVTLSSSPKGVLHNSSDNAVWLVSADNTLKKIVTTGYSSSGTFTSRVLDTGANSTNALGPLTFVATTPTATSCELQMAGSSDNVTWSSFIGPDGTTGSYFTSSSTAIPASLYGMRYLKYKVYLSTSAVSATPEFSSVSATFTSGLSADRTIVASVSANDFTINPIALVTSNVEPASLVVGTTGNAVISFTPIINIASGDSIDVTFPAGFDVSAAAYVNGNISAPGASVSGQVVSVTLGTSITAPTAVSFTLSGIKNPADTGSGGAYVITVRDSVGNPAQKAASVTADTFVNGGALSSTNVEPATRYAGVVENMEVDFTTVNPIPADGKIIITFPTGFVLSSGSATTATSTDIGGTLTTSVSGQVATVTRSGGAALAAGSYSLTLTNVKNPTAGGLTGTYAIQTNTSSANTTTGRIDIDAAVAADHIIGAPTATSITPALLNAGATSDTTVAFTTVTAIPAGGDIEIDFPTGFDLSGTLAYVSGNDGSTVSASGQMLTITTGTLIGANSSAEIVISGITNPMLLGATGTYAIRTKTEAGVLIDEGTAAANTITLPTLTLLTPSEASISTYVGDAYNVTWSSAGAINANSITLYFSYDGGENYTAFVGSLANSPQSYTATIPAVPVPGITNMAKISAVFTDDNDTDHAVTDVSDNNFTIIPAVITTASASPAELSAGYEGPVTVDFTAINPIPATGKIVFTFPANFTFDIGDSTAATSTTMDGVFSLSRTGQVITLTRSGGAASTAGSQQLVFSNIKNPTIIGTTGTYSLQTQNAAGSPIDNINSITGSLIVSAATNYLTISAPADITAGGTRADYTITRYDQYDNLSSVGSETFYLYSTSEGENYNFFDDPSAGSVITSITLANDVSSGHVYYYDEKMGAYTITVSDNATSPDASTGIIDATDSLNVLHASVDHLKFAADIATAEAKQVASTFELPAILAVDAYDNTVTDDYGATAYSGAKTITYTLSGLSNAPDANADDYYSSDGLQSGVVYFTNGTSTSLLQATLYRAQQTTITPVDSELTGANIASNLVTVNPNTATKLVFKQQPSTSGIVNIAFTTQPIVAIQDGFGNQTADTYGIKLYDSSSSELPYTNAPGNLGSAHTDNTLAAENGQAAFSGVNYDTTGSIYLYATAPTYSLNPAFSTGIALVTSSTSSVIAAATPLANFNLIPTNDSAETQFAVLKFRIRDAGADGTPTLVDQAKIAIGGTGANAATDIAGASLYLGEVKIADAASIANDYITFGAEADGDSTAALYSIADNTSPEFTVYIYMKDGQLSATDGQTYTFTTNEDLISVDTGASSNMIANSSAVSAVTGTVTVSVSHLEIVTAENATSLTMDAGTTAELVVRATDANKNIDKDYTGIHVLVFTGLNSTTRGANTYYPKIETTLFGYSISSISFTQGISAAGAVTLSAYKRETSTVVAQESGKSYEQFGLAVTVNPVAAGYFSIVSGNNQSGRTSWALGSPFITLVSDTYGNGAGAGSEVVFSIASAPAGATGQSLSAETTATDENGQAATTLTIGNAAGTYQVTATSAGLSGSPLTFSATGLVPALLQSYSGNNQSKAVAYALDAPLVVKVADPSGIAIPHETVSFAISSYPDGATGQALSATSGITDSNGLVSVTFTLGTKAGSYKIAVTSGTLPALELTATAVARAPYKVVLDGPVSVKAGDISTIYTVSIQDEYDNSSNLASSTVFSLTKDPARSSGTFYSDLTGSNAITSLTFASGSNSGSFYYKDTATGTANLTVTRTSGQSLTTASDVQAVTILPADIYRFVVTGSTDTITAGATKTLTVTAYDTQGNVKSDYAGDVNIVFSGANSSPAPSESAPTCVNSSSEDINFGASTSLTFTSGVATTTATFYKAESLMLKATSGAVATADADALSFTVRHGAANHLKFAADLLTPQVAGQEFNFETTLNGVDLYDNICDGTNGATVFSGSKTITWALSGTANGPEGDVIDEFVSPVAFTAGVSTTTLKAKLYRAQDTTITASTASLTGTNVASNTITVQPGAVAKLRFSQQPSAGCITTQVLEVQPKVAVSDQYGNAVTSSSANVSLSASLDNSAYVAVSNGVLSATGGLTQSTVNGVASFSGLTYDYPENIYLRATVSGVALTAVYSSQISFTTASEAVVSPGTLTEATTISSLANAVTTKSDILDFKVTDGGSDGFGTKVKQIIVKRNTAVDTTADWTSFIEGAYITDGLTQTLGVIEGDQITFGSGNSVLYTITNGASKTFTLSLFLKPALPSGADGKIFSFSVDADSDITVDTVSSKFAASSAVVASPVLTVIATDFAVSGSYTMNAGSSQLITLRAIDTLGNIDKDYSGDKAITFSGASTSLRGNIPTATSFAGTDVAFGTATSISFADGLSSSDISMKLYTAEVATVKATDGSLTTSNANALTVTVAGGTATGLTWLVQPVSVVVENAPWKEFTIAVTDAYGNTSSSSTEVTVAPSAGSLSTNALATVTAVSGVSTFYNFAVNGLTDGQSISLSATASGITGSGASSLVQVFKQYAVTMNVKDYTSATNMTECNLAATLSGVVVDGFPKTGNSPFSFNLPYGVYTFTVSKEGYVDENTEKTAGVAADYLDGTYDAKIAWTLTATSLTEATADYSVEGAYVYDESTDKLSIRVWLERRGKLVVNDDVNKLGITTIEIYNDTTNTWLTPITISPPAGTDYTSGVYLKEISKVVATGDADDAFDLTSGKTYFVRTTVKYGGLAGTSRSYEGGSTFSVTVSESLKTVTSAIQTIATTIAGQTSAIQQTVKEEIEGQITGVVVPKITEVNDTATKILAATGTESLSDKITEVKTQVVDEVQPHITSGILNSETSVRQGSKLAIRYRTDTGLAPRLSVYSPKDVLLVASRAMSEIGTTGVYESSLTFLTGWGTGDFTIICSEATKGTVDAIVISVRTSDIEDLSSNVSAVIGNTSGIAGLKGISDTLTAQFAEIDKILTQVSQDVAGKVEDTKGAVNELSSVVKQLDDVSKQIKSIGGTKGINLEKLYEVSKDKNSDITYIKNKSEELKAAMEINQKMIENVAKKPVVQTWFEFK